MLLKGLLHLLKGLENPQVVGELAGGLGHAGEGGEHVGVRLPGVGLAGDGHALGEAHLLRHQMLQLLDLLLVPLEQLHEAGLGAGGALGPPEAELADLELQVLHIHHQLVHPQRRPFAHGGQLGGLEVGVGQAGQVLILPGKGGEIPQHLGALAQDQVGGVPQDKKVGVVPHVAAGGTQVDDGLRVRALLAVGVDVAHNVVADQLFPGLRHVVVHVVRVGLQLMDLLLGDVQAQLALGLRQGDPQLPPGAELIVVGEEVLHLPAGVAGGQGRGIAVAVSFHSALLLSRACCGLRCGASRVPDRYTPQTGRPCCPR